MAYIVTGQPPKVTRFTRANISDRRGCACEFSQAAKMAPTPFETASLKKERKSMKNLIAYYETHISGGYLVECYVEGRWECIFRHEGDYETLYAECERRAAIRKARLEALIQGLPALAPSRG